MMLAAPVQEGQSNGHEFDFQLEHCHLLAWELTFASVNLTFFICEMEVMIQ